MDRHSSHTVNKLSASGVTSGGTTYSGIATSRQLVDEDYGVSLTHPKKNAPQNQESPHPATHASHQATHNEHQ